jgi:hypothetical protein
MVHLRGVINKIEGPDQFVFEGKTISGFSFFLSDGKTERRCVIIGAIGRAGKIELDDETIIENAKVSNDNVWIGESTRLLLRRLKNMMIGEVRKMECRIEGDGCEKLVVVIGNREATWDRENALRFLGVDVADDISLCTISDLKKEAILNTKVAIKEAEGKICRV